MEYYNELLSFLEKNALASRSEIGKGIGFTGSPATLKRMLAAGQARGEIRASGAGRGTRYSLADSNMGSNARKYPDGIQTFEKIVSEGYVYVDKTALVYELANSASTYLFLSRPRRFGKSLLISTLKAYFEGHSEWFRGLAIERMEKEWHRYPVVRLDLSTAGDALDKEQLYIKLGSILSENEEALGLPANDTLPGERLNAIVRNAFEKYGEKVVILIDEYDAPLLGYLYDEGQGELFRKILKELFAPIKKLDPYLRFTLLTGITKYSQMSIFSTLNNLNDISMDDKYATLCGFSDDEMQSVLRGDITMFARQSDISPELAFESFKHRYDGYHFTQSGPGVYNPFSVLKAFAKGQMADYWFESGTPAILLATLRKFNTDISEIDGVEVMASAFNQPADTVNNAVSLFYQSGYLTIKDYNKQLNSFILGIPNAEVRAGLMENLLPLATGKNPIESQNLAIRFKDALLHNDIAKALELLKGFFASIPYPEFGRDFQNSFEQKEAYFKRLFYLVFSFMNVQIYTEVMNSGGRTDALMTIGDTIYVIEAKLDAPSASVALSQIDEKQYAARFAGTDRKIVCIGLNFSSETRTISDWVLRVS